MLDFFKHHLNADSHVRTHIYTHTTIIKIKIKIKTVYCHVASTWNLDVVAYIIVDHFIQCSVYTCKHIIYYCRLMCMSTSINCSLMLCLNVVRGMQYNAQNV